jgi:hypothetical protein
MYLSLLPSTSSVSRYLRLVVLARLQNLTVVLEAFGLVLSWRWCWLELHVGVADAEHIGSRHFGVCVVNLESVRVEDWKLLSGNLRRVSIV